MTLEQTQQRVKDCVAEAAPGKWITGGQWDASALGQVPNRAMLDAVAPDNPVLLDDTSGHSAWGNAKALAVAGITRATPDPQGAAPITGALDECECEFSFEMKVTRLLETSRVTKPYTGEQWAEIVALGRQPPGP